MAPNLPNLKPGDVVAGRFRIVEIIGSGGFSVVYRAHQEDMNRFVALKVLKPTASHDAKIVERFRREAYFASYLSHANTITLYDYGHTDTGLCYIAMEYLVGNDLSVVVQRHEPMDLKRVWKILVQSCRSLAEAHRLGLVHRDLKPENIFLTQREEQEYVKVLDFGVSKAITNIGDAGPNTMRPLTQEGTVFGTPLYMAPEQAMAEEITPAVDVYALGHIAFEMITGHAAYERCTNAMDVMLRQINDPPLALPDPWSDSPFSELITQCTQKDPNYRIPSASVLLDNLMAPEFDTYADPMEKPSRPRTQALQAVAVDPADLLDDKEIEELYRWELDTLEATFKECQSTNQPRLVVIRGVPGSGRSNLLRAFLRRSRGADNTLVLHRGPSAEASETSLETELSVLTGKALQGSGIVEVKRLLMELHGEDQELAFSADQIQRDSRPLQALSSMRDSLLARISGPFRALAKRRTLVWGLENLERLDTLTLAFLDRFFRDLQSDPKPVMLVVTVDPDELGQRTGLARYTESLLQAGRPFARQMHLVTEDEDEEVLATQRMQAIPEFVQRDGSYVGAGLSDSEADDEPLTQRLELDETPQDSSSAFDTILGYLAQLGDEVPLDLWKLVYARILSTDLIRVADMVIHQAEKFGILHIHDEVIRFSKPGFAETLRQGFEDIEGVKAAHLKLAELMQQFYNQPSLTQVKLIASHYRRGGKSAQALNILMDQGEMAFQRLDLDSAREFYLSVQKIVESDAPPPSGWGLEEAQIWLRLGEVHGALREHGAAEDALNKAMRTLRLDDRETEGKANKLLGDLAVYQERYTDALKYFDKARDAYRVMGSNRPFVAITNEMGRVALLQGRTGLSEDLSRQALEMAQRLQEPLLLARVNRQLGGVLTRRGRFSEAREHLKHALSIFESRARDSDTVECLIELGQAEFADASYADAQDHFRRAIGLAASHHHNSLHDANLGLAWAYAAQGHVAEATEHLEQVLSRVRANQDRQRITEVLLHLGDARFAAGNLADARVSYNGTLELAEAIGLRRIWVAAMVRLAYLHLEEGEEPQVFKALGKALSRCEELGYTEGQLQVKSHVIYIQLLLYGFPPSGETFSGLLQKEEDSPRVASLTYLFRADVAAARGEFANALSFLRYAHVSAAQVGDYTMFIPIARRLNLVKDAMAQPVDPLTNGWGLGAMVPPEVGRRRFDRLPKAG